MTERQLHLNAFLMGVGHHEAAWRHPRTDPKALDDVAHFQNLAQIAERGTFDSVFLADGVQIWGDVRHTAAGRFEPLTLLTGLSQVTDHIGLIATASTGFSEPYNLARLFSSLDHISGGRAGWNVVTTAQDRSAENFNRDTNTEHGERYQRADEFLDVVTALWDSWEDDALVVDQGSGVFADEAKVHEIGHKVRFFSVRGPLNAVRSPHQVVAGTPEQIADHIELWFRSGAADGFNVMAPLLPSELEEFVDQVVPLLRERGLFRTEYTGTSLRDHYGLPRPVSRYAAG